MNTLGVLLRTEWVKTVKRRSFWVAAGAFALFTAIPVIEGARSWPNIVGAAGPGPFIVGILMILLVAPEFSWRTARQSVIDGMSKERFYAGKVILLAGVILLFMTTVVLLGAGGMLVSPGQGGGEFVRPTDLSYMSGLALSMLLAGSGGLMLSMLIRSSGPAMGILFLYFVAEEVIGWLLLQAGGGLQRATQYLPSNILEELSEDLAHYPELLASVNAERAERGLDPWEFLDVQVLAAAALTYSALFLGLALLNMRRRDL